MPFNLLLFPLVGGYYLIIRFRRFRYIHQRLERQKLLFNAVIAGTFLLIVAFALTFMARHLFAGQVEQLNRFLAINIPYFGTTILSFFLGIIIAEVGNLFVNNTRAISDSIDVIGNELELLLKTSFNEDRLVQITLKNDKFYVGWVLTLPIPQQSNYIKILPAFSGHRHPENKRLVFTTQYLNVYATYIREGLITSLEDLNVNLIIRIDEIITASRFDIEMYERFNSPEQMPAGI